MPIALPRRMLDTVEAQRLSGPQAANWRRWGPYLSDRQWGTVREDYSPGGDAWGYFTHDQARSRAYRWGEDGIAGFGDDKLRWCLALAVWNGQDPIVKERLFGLTNEEGNHGEDVKELYYYVDATPSHSYLRMLYKYPHRAFPYADLVDESGRRDATESEYEILDTGVFDDERYFDISVEYAKAAHDDILMCIRIENRGNAAASLTVLPQFWARNIWSWSGTRDKPTLTLRDGAVLATHPDHELDDFVLSADGAPEWLFCENDTNEARVFGPAAGATPGAAAPGPFKDGINDYVVHGTAAAVRRDRGTRCAARFQVDLAAHGTATLRLRLSPAATYNAATAFRTFDATLAARRGEADDFYAALQVDIASADARLVQRQALAGMIWSKQYYELDMLRWLEGDAAQPPPPPERRHHRNSDWRHLCNGEILSMPDKWEYPWYASWDLAFHAVTFAMIDPGFAKRQLLLLVHDRYMHPNGQLPAYEWEFSDANPPVHAWAAWKVFEIERGQTGVGDLDFLERILHKLMLNFTWWVNRKDAQGRNIFQGGFLGLDNIEIFDRSSPLPTGGRIDQADGTAWMAAYALNLMRIALELALTDRAYDDIAVKFFEHFLYIAEAAIRPGAASAGTRNDREPRGFADEDSFGLWDEQDEFFYDVLSLPDASAMPIRIHSVVGLIPLFAIHVLDREVVDGVPHLSERLNWFLTHRPQLASLVSRWTERGQGDRALLSLLRRFRTESLLHRMLDESEFLSPHGVRSVSKYHEQNPFIFDYAGGRSEVRYVPGESDSHLFGGNSNWRGPVWMPINYLLIEALREAHRYYGDSFLIEYPTGSGTRLPVDQIADLLAARMASLYLKGADGKRPSMSAYERLYGERAHDEILFHEYYHGDTGRGLGASHQTGWSGLIALLLQPRTPDTPAERMGDTLDERVSPMPAPATAQATANNPAAPKGT